jgi:hypothetical protein
VADYSDLGPTLQLTAVADAAGQNPFGVGFWTVTAAEQDLNVKVALAEIYQITIDGPIGSSFMMYRNTRPWNKVLQGWFNYCDPIEPMFVRPGDSVYLYWNSTRAPTPTATLWLRYDVSLPENGAVDVNG